MAVSSRTIVILLINLIAVTIIETILIVRSTDFHKEKQGMDIYIPEHKIAGGQVMVYVGNTTEQGKDQLRI